jgi:predicted ribosomally synthesized peptide with nif11-like leader
MFIMSANDLQALLAQAFEEPELEARLQDRQADPVAVAASAGYSITAEEFNNAQKSWENWRISSVHDEEI